MRSQGLSSSIWRSLDSPGWAGWCIPGTRCLICLCSSAVSAHCISPCSALLCPFFLIPSLLFCPLSPHLFMWLWISFSLGEGCRGSEDKGTITLGHPLVLLVCVNLGRARPWCPLRAVSPRAMSPVTSSGAETKAGAGRLQPPGSSSKSHSSLLPRGCCLSVVA